MRARLQDSRNLTLIFLPVLSMEMQKLRDAFAGLLHFKNDADQEFALDCLKKALKDFFKGDIPGAALGHLVNALHFSKHTKKQAIDVAISDLRPQYWSIPKQLKKFEPAAAA